MIDPLLPVGEGHTELSDDDREGLIPAYITTRGELNDAEQRNIAKAIIRRRKPTVDRLLDDKYLRELHAAMFGEVWSWAGQYRLRETNIGVDPSIVSGEVRNLTQDVRAWVDHDTYPADEIAVRFHHRLVAIHAFPNGNGRHSRVAADYLVQALGDGPFSWGANLTVSTDELRERYLSSLHDADAGSVEKLLEFARS